MARFAHSAALRVGEGNLVAGGMEDGREARDYRATGRLFRDAKPRGVYGSSKLFARGSDLR